MPWLVLVLGVSSLAGLELGAGRIASLERGTPTVAVGTELRARGAVVGPPRIGSGGTRFVLDSGDGRIGVDLRGERADLEQGSIVAVTGRSRAVEEWERGLWERDGARAVVTAREVTISRHRRGGLAGLLDGVRSRARDALGDGTSEPAANLLRGFVLGEDDRIAEAVREDFRRSGLAHVLAVSGQNVMLLALLAGPLLGVLGLTLRTRLVAVIIVIAVYVPVAGAGPSIQRAGVMGAAGLVAALAGRPRAGWYALGLAAVATLALDPRATGDIGWQLSFAAVAGLFLLARPLAVALFPGAAKGRPPTALRGLLSEGAAITLAATATTAPLVSHHFGVVSLTALPANLLALPAIAPAMWLGMLSAALGQVPGMPVEPLTALGGLCASYVGWVAHALGPDWAQLEVSAPGALSTAAMTLALVLALRLACAALARRRALTPRVERTGWRLPAALAAAVAALALSILASDGEPAPFDGFELRVLDVGQGDAILLQVPGVDPVLVDTGPPGAALERLEQLGVEALAALIATHDQLDHVGGLGEIAAAMPVERVVAAAGPPLAGCRHQLECPPLERVEAGDRLRVGRLRIEVLWPPGRGDAGEDPNARSLVMHVRYGRFDALLTGDAESELAAYRAPPVELLKVAHHGSTDTGLAALLDHASPALAVISVGEGNPFGHPTDETLAALGESGVPVLRTDLEGELVVRATGDGWTVE